MDVKTYRAKTMQDALALVRRDLGPKAAVLHTREVRTGGLLCWVRGSRLIEVTASATVPVPSRLARRRTQPQVPAGELVSRRTLMPSSGIDLEQAPRIDFPDGLRKDLNDLQTRVEDLYRRHTPSARRDFPEAFFRLFTDLIEADFSEELAREFVQRAAEESAGDELDNVDLAKARIAQMIERELSVSGAIQVTPGRRHLVALVGPTGVGKTTTIAKLAASFRLKEKRRVGLITVDTYRIAAVEQLRTYADIIDLPMEVVSTPREMRQAVGRLANLELILMDTAGRSPRDEVKIQELKSLLAEAQPDEVQLVLSSVAGAASLEKMAEQFASVGTTALLLTKLDEATSLGNLVPLLRASKLPLSYLTNGQNVPDDIEAAEPRRLARILLGIEAGTRRSMVC